MDDLISKEDSYYISKRQDMLKFIDIKVSKILEIGCGEGNFATNFTDIEYWGVEPATQHAKVAEQKGFKILNGLYENVEDKIPNAYFDLIVCNDVIEHMIDPIGFLKNVKKKLKPTGKLIASIPNIRYAPILHKLIFEADFEYAQSGIMDYTHLHFFTHKSFRKIAESTGWNVDLIEPINIQPFRPITNLLLKIFEHKYHDLRNAQFVIRLSIPFSAKS